MNTWLVSRNELTPEQMRAIELSPHEHRVILGAPGSGKTQILLHRARYLCDTFQVAEDRLHIFSLYEPAQKLHSLGPAAPEPSF